MEKPLLHLSEDDIILLREGKYEKMSVFSQRYKFKKIGVYNYLETYDDEEVYYINHSHCRELFLDKDKKIIFHSNYRFECYSGTEQTELINYINENLQFINNLGESSFNNAFFIDKEVSSVQKGNDAYGHVMDELFNLFDFNNKMLLSEKKYGIPLIFYMKMHATQNYKLLGDYLFDGKLINTEQYCEKIIKFRKLNLVRNYIDQDSFHLFPKFSRDKVLSRVEHNNELAKSKRLSLNKDNCLEKNRQEGINEELLYNPISNNNIFITRGKARSHSRNIDNQDEVGEYLETMGYTIINPEKITLDELINHIHNASNIVMTWGSTMTNMCYLKENTNVIVLKSKSYEGEPNFFQKIINNYKLNVKILLHVDNEIVIPFL